MATWDLRRLQMHLQKHQLLPVYLLVGEEPFLVEEALSGIKGVALDGGASDFNSDTFFAADDDAVKIRDTVEMLPMMSPRRLVLVRGVHQFKDGEWESLYPVLQNPVDTSVLVLIAEKMDRRKKHYKMLESVGAVVELPRPYDNQLSPWIEYIASKLELKVTREASALLRQLIGASLTELYREMTKIRDFLGDQKVVEADVVLNVVSRSRSDSVFDLTNAIGRKDRAGALHSLAQILNQGQNEVGTLSMIARHFRILGQVRDGIKKGTPASQIAVKAGIPQFFLKDYQEQAKLWSDDKIGRAVHALKETDKALKSSPISSHIWLENFILKTCDKH